MKIGLADMTQQDEITLIFQREIFSKGGRMRNWCALDTVFVLHLRRVIATGVGIARVA
jgi:hypothetical protein